MEEKGAHGRRGGETNKRVLKTRSGGAMNEIRLHKGKTNGLSQGEPGKGPRNKEADLSGVGFSHSFCCTRYYAAICSSSLHITHNTTVLQTS